MSTMHEMEIPEGLTTADVVLMPPDCVQFLADIKF